MSYLTVAVAEQLSAVFDSLLFGIVRFIVPEVLAKRRQDHTKAE